jgi:hypothetical protein
VWDVILMEEVDKWFVCLAESDKELATSIEAAIDVLADQGPTLGRPLVDRVTGSQYHNMKELRPLATTVRILFMFDPERRAILLVAGDKAGRWTEWYEDNIPVAETRYREWCAGERDKERR